MTLLAHYYSSRDALMRFSQIRRCISPMTHATLGLSIVNDVFFSSGFFKDIQQSQHDKGFFSLLASTLKQKRRNKSAKGRFNV